MSTRGPDRKVSDSELLHVVEHSDRPFATAKQIADKTGLSSWRVRQRMEMLADADKVMLAQVGGSVYIYWLNESF